MLKRTITTLFMATLCSAFLPNAYASDEIIGSVARVQGIAFTSNNGREEILTQGAYVKEASTITTGPNSRLQIDFVDQSQMILGEKASVSLDEMNLNPPWWSFESASQKISVVKGTFRFITGLIAKQDRNALTFRTPVATIGVRGTDFFGGPLATGMPPGEIHYGFMIIDGAVSVDNPHGSSVLDQKNEGTFLPMNGSKAPTPTKVWSAEAINESIASIKFDNE